MSFLFCTQWKLPWPKLCMHNCKDSPHSPVLFYSLEIRVKLHGRLLSVLQFWRSEFETFSGAGLSEGRNVLCLLFDRHFNVLCLLFDRHFKVLCLLFDRHFNVLCLLFHRHFNVLFLLFDRHFNVLCLLFDRHFNVLCLLFDRHLKLNINLYYR